MELQAAELRIGNLVNFNNISIGEVTVLNNTRNIGIVLENGVYRDNNDLFKPIPLTEEWLVKLGLKQDTIDKYWYFHPTYNKFYPLYRRGVYWGFNGLGLGVKEIKYVHQLQNLYFALTGEELTVK